LWEGMEGSGEWGGGGGGGGGGGKEYRLEGRWVVLSSDFSLIFLQWLGRPKWLGLLFVSY